MVISFFSLTSLFVLNSCSKSSDNSSQNTATNNTHWTFNGSTYKDSVGAVFNFDASDHSLVALDNNGNVVEIVFSSLNKPVTGTFTVIRWDSMPFTTPTQCHVLMGNSYTSAVIQYESLGKKGDVVNVVAASDGKLSATFTNVTLVDVLNANNTYLSSGTVIEE